LTERSESQGLKYAAQSLLACVFGAYAIQKPLCGERLVLSAVEVSRTMTKEKYAFALI
jgi:hypothetical protein